MLSLFLLVAPVCALPIHKQVDEKLEEYLALLLVHGSALLAIETLLYGLQAL